VTVTVQVSYASRERVSVYVAKNGTTRHDDQGRIFFFLVLSSVWFVVWLGVISILKSVEIQGTSGDGGIGGDDEHDGSIGGGGGGDSGRGWDTI